jgi:hypothetical protein
LSPAHWLHFSPALTVRNLIDQIVVHWDEATGDHVVTLEGRIMELLRAATNETAAALGAAADFAVNGCGGTPWLIPNSGSVPAAPLDIPMGIF